MEYLNGLGDNSSKKNYFASNKIMKATIQTLKNVRQGPNFAAYLCLFAVCILWGTTWVVSSYSVRQGISAMQVVAVRQIVAGGILFVSMMIYHKGALKWPSMKFTLFLSLLNFVFSNGLSTWGVQYLPAGLASIIGATYPLWLVIFYYLFFGRTISSKIWTGMLICFVGLVLVFSPNIIGTTLKDNFLFGLALSIFSSMTWALGNIYTKRQNTHDVNPYFSLSLQMLISGSIITVILSGTHQLTPWSSIPVNVWASIMYLVIAGSLVAYSCFLYALKFLPAEQVSVYAYVNPIVALFISHLFMGEQVTVVLLIGTAVVLLGLYVLNKAFKV
jgi:drug/metabolite transporter (DMT)-like permease